MVNRIIIKKLKISIKCFKDKVHKLEVNSNKLNNNFQNKISSMNNKILISSQIKTFIINSKTFKINK